jgi:SAM-dependent methyltransferase
MWREEFVPLLLRYLDIKPGQKVVDVGCGTGPLTRLLAKGLGGRGEVIGIDRNEQLVRQARKLTRESGLDRQVSYRVDDATRLKLEDDFADRVVCQTVLWTMRNPRDAIAEMIRICKPGGMVGAVEGATDTINLYYHTDKRLTALQRKYWSYEARGFEKLEGLDRSVGYKIPGLFGELGLQRIRLDAYARSELDMDDRIPMEDKLEMYRYQLHSLEQDGGLSEREKKTLRAGGMNEAEMKEYARRLRRFLKAVAKDEEAVRRSSSTNVRIAFITTGIKPATSILKR